MCQAYHLMEGGPHRTCVDGQWIGEIKCLSKFQLNLYMLNCNDSLLETLFVARSASEN